MKTACSLFPIPIFIDPFYESVDWLSFNTDRAYCLSAIVISEHRLSSAAAYLGGRVRMTEACLRYLLICFQ